MATKETFDFLIQWHLTELCNLKCTHCYQHGHGSDELALDEVLSTINEIESTLEIWEDAYAMAFSSSVNITGGEPLLRNDLFEVISAFHNIGFDTYLLTNGIFIDNNIAKKLCALNVKGVQISIEGPEGIHDSIRGKNSFKQSIRGVKLLKDAGMEVTLNATVSEINAAYLTDTVKLASGLGADRLGFSRLVPSGRGRSLLKELMKTSEVKSLYEKIFSIKPDNGLEIVTGDPVASQFRNKTGNKDYGDIALGGCAAGISGLTIMPDGTVVPCRRLPVPVGNIRKNSIREIWAMSPVLNDLRDRGKYKGKCRTCDNWANCRGCRAIAYSYSASKGEADILAPDPQCFI
ncbi:MAG: radical SAM protein [Nitrospiraceae bacterium]|nr:MAG: radical SAM protein [Nitrospiraceae bacterium]